MKTIRGIYYDLNESTYIFKIDNLEFYFSSEFYKNKFIENYESFILTETLKLNNKYKCKLDAKTMFLITLYKKIETRGFKIKIDNLDIINTNFKLVLESR